MPQTWPERRSAFQVYVFASNGSLRRHPHIPFTGSWYCKNFRKIARHLSRKPLPPELIPERDPDVANNSTDTARLLEQARAGDQAALNELFARHRPRLRRMVELRLDRRLQARIDVSDVIQEAYVEAVTRLEEYLRSPSYPLFLWLRLLVGERLLKLHRHHLGTQMRDAGLEVSIYRGALPAASSAALAAQLLGKHTSPTQAAVRAERMMRLQEALNTLDPMDREVLSRRHFEEMTLAETALSLGIGEAAAAKRYIRALKRLKAILATMPGGLDDV
jgi:RNA polymerase sigma-70 factor (ECF subfamily)